MSDIVKKVLVAVVVTVLLAVLSYIGETLFYPTPDVNGKWQFESTVEKTKYQPYLGMVLTFIVFLNQNDLEITGTGEKVKEMLDGREKEYIGAQRVRVDITGRIEKKFFGDDILHLNYEEYGTLRTSTTQQTLIYKQNRMVGTYVSSVADQSGNVGWVRR